MNTIAFAVLLSIMQALPPGPGKAADTGTHHSTKIKKYSGNKQRPSTAPIIQKPVETQTKDYGSTPQTNKDEQRPVLIGQPVTVNVRTSLADWLYVAFTGLLVGVGSYGVVMARRTLKAINRQIDKMEEQRGVMQGQL